MTSRVEVSCSSRLSNPWRNEEAEELHNTRSFRLVCHGNRVILSETLSSRSAHPQDCLPHSFHRQIDAITRRIAVISTWHFGKQLVFS